MEKALESVKQYRYSNCQKKMCFSVPENIIKKGKEVAKRRSKRSSSNGDDEKEKRGLLSKEIDKWKLQQKEVHDGNYNSAPPMLSNNSSHPT
ncbi:hypothetical protein AgCh_009209 [Apium graveolens]